MYVFSTEQMPLPLLKAHTVLQEAYSKILQGKKKKFNKQICIQNFKIHFIFQVQHQRNKIIIIKNRFKPSLQQFDLIAFDTYNLLRGTVN